MYRYDEFDRSFVNARVRQFQDQVKRRLKGQLSEEEFKPLRLMNGLYLQLHAYMLRVAIPYGCFSARQLRGLAHIARQYDRGYGHFTTRQNIQFNWPKLVDVPEILEHLATLEMHAIQTSGNCIRNVSADPYAGCTPDEVADPRPIAEMLRQWSSLHPEFSFLPRKFKIAVNGASIDRTALRVHDVGLQVKRNTQGEIGYELYVGGGLGRTPLIGKLLRDFLPQDELLPYMEALMRVYNRYGRRDNKYKARIKILVQEIGIKDFYTAVEKEYAVLTPSDIALPGNEYQRIASYFAPPPYEDLPDNCPAHAVQIEKDTGFANWCTQNLSPHKISGYSIVNISLKDPKCAPGDISAMQMEALAALAEKFSYSEIRSTHEQNLVLAHVKKPDLYALYQGLCACSLAQANIGLISDIICCPGMDYCALATARSIPIAHAIAERFSDPQTQQILGEMKIKISGCINACGHHHVGHIGILGLEKAGVETYQLKLGGSARETSSLGDITGPGFSQSQLLDGLERMMAFYLANRQTEGQKQPEIFLDTYRRLGMEKFKKVLYEHP